MGCCQAKLPEADMAAKHSSVMDERKIKLLFLGASDSGKSTIFKQMKIIFGDGFDEDALRQSTSVIYNNTIVGMRTIVEACATLAIPIVATDRAAEFMKEVKADAVVDEYVKGLIKDLWADSGIRSAYERRAEYQLFDSAKYFFKEVDRIARPDYSPTVDDVLQSHVRTSGIVEKKFAVDEVPFEMFDVGGQRSERKKWIHCYEDLDAIIFVAALSDYDQVLYEDKSQNRMVEAIELFGEICNLEWFRRTSMILFLNKKDLFEQKIKKKDIRMPIPTKPGEFLFEDYSFGLCTCSGGYPSEEVCDCGVQENAKTYLQNKFVEVNRNEEKSVFTSFTCATDSSNVRKVFDAFKDILIPSHYNGHGNKSPFI